MGHITGNREIRSRQLGLSDTINSGYAKVDVVKRFPSSGMPPKGVSFSVEIQVQTFLAAVSFRAPFACPDAFIVARGLNKYNNEILGWSFVRTNAFDNCTGTARLTFDPKFRPGPNDYVQFELYPGGSVEFFSSKTTIEKVRNGDVKMIAKSQPMKFDSDEKTLRESGVIGSEENQNILHQAAGFFDSTTGPIFRKATAFVGVSLAAYLVWKNGDLIQKKLQEYSK